MGSEEKIAESDEVYIGNIDASVDTEDFVEALAGTIRLAEAMQEIRDELMDLNVGLDEDDAARLIYGRNSDLNITTIEEAFDAINEIADADPQQMGKRLLSKQSDLTIKEAAKVLKEMGNLAEKYDIEKIQDQQETDT